MCENIGVLGSLGLKLFEGSHNWIVRRCTFNRNSAIGIGDSIPVLAIGCGVLVSVVAGSSNGNLFEDCVASGNFAFDIANLITIAGFRISGERNCLRRCTAKNNQNFSLFPIGDGNGFFISSFGSNNLIQECTAVGNDDHGFSNSGGFSNTFLGNVANGNGSFEYSGDIKFESWDLSASPTPPVAYILPDIQNLEIVP